MKWLKRFLWLALIVAAAAVAVIEAAPWLNGYQKDGELTLPGLSAPVTVKRDAQGMAYIHAANLDDALLAQGFVTAQDRLFQMQLTRLYAAGRISELIGPKGRDLDLRMRTIGVLRLAKKQTAILHQRNRRVIQRYVDGVNAFIRLCPGDLPLEFKLAGIAAEPWRVEDSLSILYLMAFSTSGNLQHEITAQALVDKVGPERAAEIMPLNVNPDVSPAPAPAKPLAAGAGPVGVLADGLLAGWQEDSPLRLGSNNWAVSSRRNPAGKPIVAGDPHLDARILPGPWYPLGLITPETRAVGAMIPGMPGMVLGRTQSLALAMTNAYGDVQDLYLETLDPQDPQRYLEGGQSKPFEIIEETLRIKDPEAENSFREEKISIRLTTRGPVVSGLLPGLGAGRVMTLRWAAAESMLPDIGLVRVLQVQNAAQLDQALQRVSMLVLNWVFADSQGNLGWRVSGRLPIRAQGEAALPQKVASGQDNWTGWIPQAEMPHALNPERGWLATANHYTVDGRFPYYYSSLAASSFRYARIKQLLSAPEPRPASAHWEYQRDTMNLLAKELVPLMAAALERGPKTRPLARLLREWDLRDQADQAAPLVFQAVLLEFARQVFEDDLGPKLTDALLENIYFWQERLLAMIKAGGSSWFDDRRTTGKIETPEDIFRRAGMTALDQLSRRLGDDPAAWRWGAVHNLELVNPLARDGFAKGILGSGPLPMGGSSETVYRARYSTARPFQVTVSAALRIVVDLADPDKIMAVLPGGVTGRLFSPHLSDQVPAFMNGVKRYWWFSDRAIEQNAKHRLLLKP
ncbi:beta-lactam acylase [Desulfocarbo indianensis]|nr:beta-lactam acylase [Desulfocarbo indianensis]